jgi:hypothetical protein
MMASRPGDGHLDERGGAREEKHQRLNEQHCAGVAPVGRVSNRCSMCQDAAFAGVI